jgi:hypothetical protein
VAGSSGVLSEPETGLEGGSSADSREEVDRALFLRRKLDLRFPNMLLRVEESEFWDVREELRLWFLEYVLRCIWDCHSGMKALLECESSMAIYKVNRKFDCDCGNVCLCNGYGAGADQENLKFLP